MRNRTEKKNPAREKSRVETKKGFTLIEVLVAALLLSMAILTASLMPLSSRTSLAM